MANEPILTLIGNLTADPELRFTPSGHAVSNFTVAQTPRTFNKDTNQHDDGEAIFMRCAAWRELGEHIAESLHRGDRVVVVGKLQARTYEKDGQNRTVHELAVDAIGPDLRYATARVTKASSGGGNQQQSSGWGGNQQSSGGGWK